MSGTRVALDELGIVDLGNAPEVFIDGLAHYSECSGIVRSSYFTNQPALTGVGNPTAPCRQLKILSLRLTLTVETQREMRRQVLALTERDPEMARAFARAAH